MTQSLAALVEATCGALDRIGVRITGAWQPGASRSGGWTRHEWHGVASAAAPVVALLCVRTGGVIEWHKSGRSVAPAALPAVLPGGTPERAPVDPAVSALASIHAMAIRLGVTVSPEEPRVGLDLHVQGAYASLATRALAGVPAAGAPALDLPAERATTTGVACDLACVPGTPEVVFSLLLITGAQVKMGRNHLWHVRPALAPALGEPLRTILSRGRRGTLAIDGLRPGPGGANIEPP